MFSVIFWNHTYYLNDHDYYLTSIDNKTDISFIIISLFPILKSGFSVAGCHEYTPVIVLQYNNVMIVTTKRHPNKFALLLGHVRQYHNQNETFPTSKRQLIPMQCLDDRWWSLMLTYMKFSSNVTSWKTVFTCGNVLNQVEECISVFSASF